MRENFFSFFNWVWGQNENGVSHMCKNLRWECICILYNSNNYERRRIGPL